MGKEGLSIFVENLVYYFYMRLVGILFSVLILVGLVVVVSLNFTFKDTSLFGGSKNPKQTAQTVTDQANLISIQNALNLYLSQNGSYPSQLSQIQTGADISPYTYTLCDSSTALVETKNGTVLKLEGGSGNFYTKASSPGC